jgi:DNA primase
VVLFFDSDTAGFEAANRALEVCLWQHIDVKLAYVPEGKDPCDYISANGKEKFERLVSEAVDVFKFKWKRLMAHFGGEETIAGKKQAIEEFLQTIAIALSAGRLPAIDQGLIVNHLSGIIGLSSKQVHAELSQRIRRLRRPVLSAVEGTEAYSDSQKVQGPVPSTSSASAGSPQAGQALSIVKEINWGQGVFAAAQREVLEVLLNEPELFEQIEGKISADDFNVPVLRQIAKLLFESLRQEAKPALGTILAKAESVDFGGNVHGLASAIAELAHTGEQKGNFQSRLIGAVEVFVRNQAGEKKNRVKAADNQEEFLRRVCEHAAIQNPHNPGMI